ncbi:DUF6499 domain-containing protein [Pandoraea capi]|uniref:transcriptional regulator domain-containing protein n=1 Tax=Pandoraea TaxID=93217 RepID=UPI001F5C0B96|nr:DUF6499 domain-containing protein [Pandoraea capi]
MPEEFRLFIARADWRDLASYPSDECFDPSIWAWEFLRRNSSYASDYAEWHDSMLDVLPVPLPRQSLKGYFCDPKPEPDMTYEKYKIAYPNGVVRPVRDVMRERWRIKSLVDPTLLAKEVEKQYPGDDWRNRLSQIFPCAAPEVLNSPTTWSSKSYLSHRSLLLLASGYCTGTEVLVRLDITGNFEVQMESLRRTIGNYFVGGTRSGSRVQKSREEFDAYIATGLGCPPSPEQRNALENFLAIKPTWNSSPSKYLSLQSTLRMVDLVASLEAGTLEAEFEARWDSSFSPISVKKQALFIDSRSTHSISHYLEEHWRLRKPLASAVRKYFKFNQVARGSFDPRYVYTYIDNAYLFSGGDHVLVARMKPGGRTKTKKS